MTKLCEGNLRDVLDSHSSDLDFVGDERCHSFMECQV